MAAAGAAVHHQKVPRMVRGRPFRPQGCSASPAATACGRPWPRSLCGPRAAGNQGPGAACPRPRAAPGPAGP